MTTDDDAPRVLHAEADDAVRTALDEALSGYRVVAADEAALELLEGAAWDCLVVGDVGERRRRALLSAADCPTALVAEPGTTPTDLLTAADTLIDWSGDLPVGVVREKLGALVGDCEGRTETALAAAVSGVQRSADAELALVLVADGEVAWESEGAQRALPPTLSPRADGGSVQGRSATAFGERLSAAGLTPDGRIRAVEVPAAESGAPDSPAVPATSGYRYYRRERHALPTGAGQALEVIRDVTDRVRERARRRLFEVLVEGAQDGLFVLDEHGIVEFCNESFADLLGYERADLVGIHPAEALAPGELERGQRAIEELLGADRESTELDVTFETKSGEERLLSLHFALQHDEDGAYAGMVGVVRDVTDREARERELAVQRDELSTLDRTHVLIQDIIRTLGEAATRSELERVVCDRLVESDRYRLAWIGERGPSEGRVQPSTAAGAATDYLDAVRVPTADGETPLGPAGRALATGEVQVVGDVRADERFGPWRQRALDHDLRSLVAVPLAHGETVHGILCVYATEAAAFTDRTVESFTVLGETVGFALTAVQNRRLLQRDAHLRVDFRSAGEGAWLGDLARACDCRIEAAGAVELDDGALQYLRVERADPGAVVAAAREHPAVERARVVREDGDGGAVELAVPDSPETALSAVGACLSEAVATPGELRIVAQTPVDADVRALKDAVERCCPDATLHAKTERERPADAGAGNGDPLAALTDRQREIVRAAHLAGYYAWPRDTTAEELADSLGIAAPTLLQHLRRAQANLVEDLFES